MLTFPLPELLHGAALTGELHAAGLVDAGLYADGDRLVVTGVEDADRGKVQSVIAAHVPPPAPEPQPDLIARLAAVEGELRGMRERAAAVAATGGAAAVRDAITGKPAT